MMAFTPRQSPGVLPWLPVILVFFTLFLSACRKESATGSPTMIAGQGNASYKGAVPPAADARLGKGNANVLAYSPDGKDVAVGGDAGLYLYRADTLADVWQIAGASPMAALAFSPDSTLLAAGDEAGNVAVIDLDSGRVLTESGETRDTGNSITSLAWTGGFAASGSPQLAIGFNDGSVLLGRVTRSVSGSDSHELVVEVEGGLDRQSSGVTAMAYSPNGRILATGNRTGVINLWDAERLEWVGMLEGHELANAILGLSWSPDGKQLLSGGKDESTILWDILTLSVISTLSEKNGPIVNVTFALDGASFASVADSGVLHVWKSEHLDEGVDTDRFVEGLSGVAWSPDGQKLLAATDSGQIQLWSLDEGLRLRERLITLTGHSMDNQWVAGMAWSPDGRRLAAGRGHQLLLWDTATAKPERILEGHTSLVSAVDWSPSGDRLVSASRDNSAIIWDAETGDRLFLLEGHTQSVADVDWSADGHWIASAGSLDDTVRVWDPESGQLVTTLSGNDFGVWSVAWSPDSHTLAAGNNDGAILFWEVDDDGRFSLEDSLRRHLNWIADLSWSPDGSRIASAGADNRVLITDLATNKAETYVGHLAPVRGVAFNHDGTRLASVSRDGLAIVWDANPGAITELLITLPGHTAGANSVAWSPDGRQLATGSDDGTVILWRIGS